MSSLLRLIQGAARSNTIRTNGIFAAIWAAIAASDMVQTNPDLVTIFGAIQIVANFILRARTAKPLAER